MPSSDRHLGETFPQFRLQWTLSTQLPRQLKKVRVSTLYHFSLFFFLWYQQYQNAPYYGFCLCPTKLRKTSQRSCWNFSFLLPFFGLCFSSRDVKLNVKKPKSSFGWNQCHLELAQLWQPIFWIQSQTRHSPVDSNSTGKLIQTEIFLRTCFWFQSNDQPAARLIWPVHVFQDLWIG